MFENVSINCPSCSFRQQDCDFWVLGLMASPAWLESSLRRSRRLGLEVLERASRRSVDWTSIRASQTPTTTDKDAHVPVKVHKCF